MIFLAMAVGLLPVAYIFWPRNILGISEQEIRDMTDEQFQAHLKGDCSCRVCRKWL